MYFLARLGLFLVKSCFCGQAGLSRSNQMSSTITVEAGESLRDIKLIYPIRIIIGQGLAISSRQVLMYRRGRVPAVLDSVHNEGGSARRVAC